MKTDQEIHKLIEAAYKLKQVREHQQACATFFDILNDQAVQSKIGRYPQSLILIRIYYGLASCYFASEQCKNAKKWVKKIKNKRPSHWLLLAKCNEKLNQINLAKSAIVQAEYHLTIVSNPQKSKPAQYDSTKYHLVHQEIQSEINAFKWRHPTLFVAAQLELAQPEHIPAFNGSSNAAIVPNFKSLRTNTQVNPKTRAKEYDQTTAKKKVQRTM